MLRIVEESDANIETMFGTHVETGASRFGKLAANTGTTCGTVTTAAKPGGNFAANGVMLGGTTEEM